MEQLRKSKIKITLLIKLESEHLGRGCFEMFTWMKYKQPWGMEWNILPQSTQFLMTASLKSFRVFCTGSGSKLGKCHPAVYETIGPEEFCKQACLTPVHHKHFNCPDSDVMHKFFTSYWSCTALCWGGLPGNWQSLKYSSPVISRASKSLQCKSPWGCRDLFWSR